MRISAVSAAILLVLSAPASAALITLSINPTTTLRAAVTRANADLLNTYDLRLAPGTYLNDFAPTITRPLTITGTYGAAYTTLRATVALPNQKGLLLTTSSLFVRGLTISGAFISNALGGNGAAIRDQSTTATTLHLDGVQIAGNQEGILTGGSGNRETVIVANSAFRNNGNASKNTGQEHALYVTDAASLTVSNSVFCGEVGAGHNIKSRALKTTISGVTSYEGAAGAGCTNAGNASRGIDIPNAGVALLSTVKLIQGAASPNGGMLEFGVEGVKYAINSLTLRDADFMSARSGIGVQWFGGTAPCTIDALSSFSGVTPVVPATACRSAFAAASAATAETQAVAEPSSFGLLAGALVLLTLFHRKSPHSRLN